MEEAFEAGFVADELWVDSMELLGWILEMELACKKGFGDFVSRSLQKDSLSVLAFSRMMRFSPNDFKVQRVIKASIGTSSSA